MVIWSFIINHKRKYLTIRKIDQYTSTGKPVDGYLRYNMQLCNVSSPIVLSVEEMLDLNIYEYLEAKKFNLL